MYISLIEYLVGLKFVLFCFVSQICGGKIISMNERSTPLMFANSGVVAVKRLDVGWMAFVTVRNTGPSPLHVVGRMLECCEVIGSDENDCTSMRLMGGSMGVLQPSLFKNVTFLYSNMYPYNRRGECFVEIWYKDKANRTDSIKVNIPFDTYIRSGFIHPSMEVFGDFDKLLTTCESPDMDPLDNCRPVDCHKKYNGNKNFYSPVRKLCLANPTCYSDPDKELPDVAYVPTCNECRDVETPISEDDLRSLLKPTAQCIHGENFPPPSLELKEYTNVRCHHGTFDNESALCFCHPGWTSAPIPEDIYIPSTLLLHFCTIRKPPARIFNVQPLLEAISSIWFNNPIFVISAAALVSLILLLFVCCCVNGRELWDSDTSGNENSDDDDYPHRDEGSIKLDGMRSLKSYFAQADYFSDTSDISNLEDIIEKTNAALGICEDESLNSHSDNSPGGCLINSENSSKSIGKSNHTPFPTHNSRKKCNPLRSNVTTHFKMFRFGSFNCKTRKDKYYKQSYGRNIIVLGAICLATNRVNRINNKKDTSNIFLKTLVKFIFHKYINIPADVFNKKFLVIKRLGVPHRFRWALENCLEDFVFPKIPNKTYIQNIKRHTIILTKSNNENAPYRSNQLSFQNQDFLRIIPEKVQNKTSTSVKSLPEGKFMNNCVGLNLFFENKSQSSKSKLMPLDGIGKLKETPSTSLVMQPECPSNSIVNIVPDPNLLFLENRSKEQQINILNNAFVKVKETIQNQSVILDIEDKTGVLPNNNKRATVLDVYKRDTNSLSKFPKNDELTLPTVHSAIRNNFINISHDRKTYESGSKNINYTISSIKHNPFERQNSVEENDNLCASYYEFKKNNAICDDGITLCPRNGEGYLMVSNKREEIKPYIGQDLYVINKPSSRCNYEQNNSEFLVNSDSINNTFKDLEKASNVKSGNIILNLDLSSYNTTEYYCIPRALECNLDPKVYSIGRKLSTESERNDTTVLGTFRLDKCLGNNSLFSDIIRSKTSNITNLSPFSLFSEKVNYNDNRNNYINLTLYDSVRNPLKLLLHDRPFANDASEMMPIFYCGSENRRLSDIFELNLCKKKFQPIYSLKNNFFNKNNLQNSSNSFGNTKEIRNSIMPKMKLKLLVSRIPIMKASTRKKTLKNLAMMPYFQRKTTNMPCDKNKQRKVIIQERPENRRCPYETRAHESSNLYWK